MKFLNFLLLLNSFIVLVACQEEPTGPGFDVPGSTTKTCHVVSNPAEIKEAIKIVKAGDTILLNDGTYRDFSLVINTSGTEEKPILIAARNGGKAIFSGNTWVELWGNHITFTGIYFKDGARIPSQWKSHGKGLLTIYGDYCTVSHCMFYRYDNAHSSYICTYLTPQGKVPQYAHIDRCAFIEKATLDQVINLNNTTEKSLTGAPAVPMYHRISYCYFSNPPKKGNAGGGIRIGYWRKDFGRCLVSYNLFERQDSEAEIITSKSMENIYYRNTYLNCRGTMNFRHGDKQIAIGNTYKGSDTQHEYGGMYIWGSNHIIAANYFELPTTLESRGNSAIYFNSGPEASEHALAFNSLMLANTFVNTAGTDLNFSSLYDRRVTDFGAANVKTPRDIKFVKNLFISNPARTQALMTDENLTYDKQTWIDNSYTGMPLGAPSPIEGLTLNNEIQVGDNFPLEQTTLETYLPYQSIEGVSFQIKQAINNSRSVRELTRSEVGPSWCSNFPGDYFDTGVFEGPTGSDIPQ